MGLIKTGIAAGALYAVAHQGIKAYERGHPANNAQQAPHPAGLRDNNGYSHQAYCNGQCNASCNGVAGQTQHQSWCSGMCGGRCEASTTGASTFYAQPPQPVQREEKLPVYQPEGKGASS